MADSVLVGTHLNPDGDALGSALAMSHFLDGLGVAHETVCHHDPPRNLQFLPGADRLRREAKHLDYGLGIILDLDSPERLGSLEPIFGRCRRIAVIDHHVPHDAPGNLRIVDTSAPATAVLLTRVLLALETEITPAIATCLLTGIVTDTGSFRFRNTTPESLALAAHLIECGADLSQVSEEIFQRKPLASSRLLGHALENMQLAEDDQLAWTYLTYEDFENANARDEDTEGFVNELLSIETVQIAAIAREAKPGKIRCSVRSRGDIDVAEAVRVFGGGGHRNAAGCTFDGDLGEAVQRLTERLKTCLASS